MKCAVANCGNKKKASVCSLFTFPVNPELRKKWIKFCRRGKDFKFINCCICMDHFAKEDFENSAKFEMGFAKKRMLKRGAVPSIYKPGDENPERSQRIKRRENKKIVSELLRQSDVSMSQEVEFISDETMEFLMKDAGEEADPLQEFEGIDEENCELEANRLSGDSALQGSPADRSVLVQEMEELQAKVETLQNENASLRIENGQLRLKEKKNVYDLEMMKKRALRAENACKNMEEKLEGIYTKGQIEKLKNGVKRPS